MAQVLRTYTEDLEIAQAILNRNEATTRSFLYKKCYPLFRAIYQNYTTDCTSCLEFINEIYLLIMTPSKKTGHCQLENFRGESSLKTWLKVTALYYCYAQYEKAERMPKFERLADQDAEKNDDAFDRIVGKQESIEIDLDEINRQDIEALLKLMPSLRYRELMRMRYVEHLSNEDVANALGINMDNYYNVHKRAKSQFEQVCRKEDYYG